MTECIVQPDLRQRVETDHDQHRVHGGHVLRRHHPRQRRRRVIICVQSMIM